MNDMMNNKLRGFSISEMLVSLVLTSIAIMLTYSVLLFTQRTVNSHRSQSDFAMEFSGFRTMLSKVVLNSSTMNDAGGGKIIVTTDKGQSVLSILRDNLEFDNGTARRRFNLKVVNYKIEHEDFAKELNLVKKILLEIEYKGQTLAINEFKVYDSDTKFRLTKESNGRN